MAHAEKLKYLYVVRQDGSVALRTSAEGTYRCPADCVPVYSDEIISPLAGVRFDFEHGIFVRPTRAQNTRATRALQGKRQGEEDARLQAIVALRELVTTPELRSLVECLVVLSPRDIRAVLDETGASAPEGEGGEPSP